ncbi:MAG: FAD-dependent oxidoreductase [Acidobacteriota bacterium]
MSKPVLLTVDDDPQVLRAVARDVRKRYGKDYSVLRADSGEAALEALEELRTRDQPVALILSDFRMPGLSGVELLTRARVLHPRAKRVLLTAYADTEAAIGAINESRLDYYLLKPWDPPEDALYPVLDDLLHDWQSSYRPGYGGLRIVGSRWSPACHELRDFLARNLVPYRYFELEGSEEARSLTREALAAEETAQESDVLPMVVLEDGSRLLQPTTSAVAEAVGMGTRAEQAFYDVAIVGGGPAGLAAAVYAASEGLRTVLLEREAPGGQAGTSSRIENYLGFPTGLSGSDLAHRALTQAKRFGVEVLTPVEVTDIEVDGRYRRLRFSDGGEVSSHIVMLSSGVSWRRLPAEGADELAGRGIYYGASMTEARRFEGQHVFVVGAGNSAGQAAMHFADWASKVTMLVRGDSLGAKMSNYLVERIDESPVIEVLLRSQIVACHGEGNLEALTIQTPNGEERHETQAVFIFIGAAPRTDWLEGTVDRDGRGFILTGADLASESLESWPLERQPYLLETNIPGVFAAGDVRHQSIKRVASAVGEGSVSVHFMHRHLASL